MMKSQEVARYPNSQQRPFSLVLNRGSIVQFQHPNGAIVNAANEGCIDGGGVDGCISDAGGRTLLQHRLALPILEESKESKESKDSENSEDSDFSDGDEVRCPTGQAKITGPGRYGSLGVEYVIHAVGPEYAMRYGNEAQNEEDEVDDGLLRSAYWESMMRAKEQRLEAVAFSLLSAGIFRGSRSLEAVLRIGMEAICDFGGYEELKEVHLFGFTDNEIVTLQQIASGITALETEGSATICEGEENNSCDAQSVASGGMTKPKEAGNGTKKLAQVRTNKRRKKKKSSMKNKKETSTALRTDKNKS